MTEPPPSPERSATAAAPRSLMGAAALRLLGGWGARVGLAWIGLLVLMAVFAPVLASSHPFVWKTAQGVSSPWLRHLTVTDAVLLGSFGVAAVLLLFRRVALGRRVAAWAFLTGALTAAATLESAAALWRDRVAGEVPLVLLMVGVLLVAVLGGMVLIAASSSARWGGKAAVGLAALVLASGLAAAPIDPPVSVVYSAYREATAAGQVQWQVRAPLAHSPGDYQRDAMSATGRDARLQKPSLAHPLGTDESGADVLSRMIHATRIALAIGLIATGIAVAIGVVVGGLMGYFAGVVDLLGMRLVEVFSAIPVIFLLIMIVAFYGRNLYLMMVILGATGWVGYATFIRAEFLKLRKMDYVQAAHACGAPLWSILFRHMLPNGITPVLVLASFGIASAILTESTLSFLGLGLVEEPSWGQLLNQARRAGGQWGLTLFPGLAIFLTVFAYNLVGEAMRDALDPKGEG